ncbi:BTAD domain-containing putative transcriptional regulator [Streptomyces hyaluromycini]|uniref:BTAD domain-containing putative transcriptional regulator n=1 Tax=Streptomyces hyaluromycini TaxID=1377993 RepID=UPI001237FE35|nr:BTAD domain-containing putative transcriptional regulator [Streptomyces hyaluromycini]
MLRLRVLGPLSAEVAGRTVELGAPRQRAVLGLLVAARGGVVPVDRMTDALWRGEPPAKAAVSLHAYLSNLRRTLEPGRPPRAPATVLVTAAPGYALRLAGDAVDAWRFETWIGRARTAPPEEARRLLAEALDWWQGPAFAEHADEEWAAVEVARLTGLRAEARELAVAADLRTGRAAQAAADAGSLVRDSPLREEGWRLLALAHWACSRRADALAALRRATAVLRAELGCDPGPALRELEHAVLNGRLDVLRAAVPEAEPVAELAARTGRGLFVGRGPELRSLDGAARAARQTGGLVLVTGAAGAGKSAFLDRAAAGLREAGWRVVIGRCPEYEGAPPAWAWVEALGALAREVPPARPEELAVLLREPESTAGPTQSEATAGRFRMHRAFAAWLRDAASRAPLAVLLEDLHRADAETLALVEAAAAVTGVPLLTVAGYRPTEVGEHLLKTLAQLAPAAPHRITLGGLTPEDTATLVDAVCGTPVDPATVTALAERTGGNPFYVLESARLLADEGALVAVSEVPQGVRDVLRRRLALLPAAARSVVQLTAVLGLEAEVALLVDAAEADEEQVLEGLDAALAAGLLAEPGPGRVRFVHALVRDTVYADLSGARRSRLHARVARLLRHHRPAELAALAHHFAHSGSAADAPLAVDYALRAAEAAERRYAHDVAVALIQQAIDTHTATTGDDAPPDRLIELLVRLLGAQVRTGATDTARRTRQRAVELAEQADRGDLVAAVYGVWTEPAAWRSRLEGRYDRTALARLERLAADPGLDGPTRARVLQALVDAVAAEDPPRALEAARDQLALARADGEPSLMAAALMTSARLLPHETRTGTRPSLTAELRDLAHAHDLPAYRWVCENLDAMTAAARNDPAAVQRHTAEGLVLARRYRMVWAQGLSAATSAMLATVAGRFEAAEAAYAEADALLQQVGAHHATGVRALALINIRLVQGRAAEIEPVVRAVYESAGAPVAVVRALVLARLGRLDEALAVPVSPEPLQDHLYGLELDFRAQLAVLHRDRDSAAALLGHLLPLRDQLAGAAGAVYASRPLAHALADLQRLLGEDRAAAEGYALAERTAHAWGSAHLAANARRAAADLAEARAGRRTFAT